MLTARTYFFKGKLGCFLRIESRLDCILGRFFPAAWLLLREVVLRILSGGYNLNFAYSLPAAIIAVALMCKALILFYERPTITFLLALSLMVLKFLAF